MRSFRSNKKEEALKYFDKVINQSNYDFFRRCVHLQMIYDSKNRKQCNLKN
jgi:hypothetical protein